MHIHTGAYTSGSKWCKNTQGHMSTEESSAHTHGDICAQAKGCMRTEVSDAHTHRGIYERKKVVHKQRGICERKYVVHIHTVT